MILLQAHTELQIERLLERPTHGILLSGPDGSGKAYTAKHVASKLLGVEKLENYPYFKSIHPEKNSLGIDQIRELQTFLQLKTPGRKGIRRAVILENAHLMTNEAQNALLKSLEEPPADTVIILTAPATQKLKDTIYSRVRQIAVMPVGKDAAQKYFRQNFSEAEVSKAFLMSGGHVGLMHALLSDTEHQLAQEIYRAKEILSASRYDRLARVEEISKQKELLPVFLQACKLICATAMEQSVQKQTDAQTKRWLSSLTAIYNAESALQHNPNAKLLITDLMLNL